MNIGTMIFTLRKEKNITQEQLAAELGVTAAAVSKWEKGYTLPDILMLGALADFFEVTTDQLLGRNSVQKQAIIVAKTGELGQKIADLVEKYKIQAKTVLTDYRTAVEAVHSAAEENIPIHYLITALDTPLLEEDMDEPGNTVNINVHVTGGTDEDYLSGIELYLRNPEAFKNILDLTANGRK